MQPDEYLWGSLILQSDVSIRKIIDLRGTLQSRHERTEDVTAECPPTSAGFAIQQGKHTFDVTKDIRGSTYFR